MTTSEVPKLTPEDYRDALTEVSFILDILAGTVDDLMGGATASVGRVAGRHQARRLPIHAPNPTVASLFEQLRSLDNLGCELELKADQCTVEIGHCFVRGVCREKAMQLGGNLCRLYHFYLDGIINEFLMRPTRSHLLSTGNCCSMRLEIR